MSFEYYIRIDDPHLEADVKARLRAALIASDIFVSEEPDYVAVKGKASDNTWDFDIRVFFSSPMLIEISSWNESVKQSFQPILRTTLDTVDYKISDEDFEEIDLF